MNKNYPVIFTGVYQGWDSPNLRIYTILNSYKGLDENSTRISLRSSLCNMFEKVGDTVFICAFIHEKDKRFLHFSNCRGTKILDKNDGKLTSFFEDKKRINKEFLSSRSDELIEILNKSLNYKSRPNDSNRNLIHKKGQTKSDLLEKIETQNWNYILIIIGFIFLSLLLFKYMKN